jgi:hypothetical protein
LMDWEEEEGLTGWGERLRQARDGHPLTPWEVLAWAGRLPGTSWAERTRDLLGDPRWLAELAWSSRWGWLAADPGGEDSLMGPWFLWGLAAPGEEHHPGKLAWLPAGPPEDGWVGLLVRGDIRGVLVRCFDGDPSWVLPLGWGVHRLLGGVRCGVPALTPWGVSEADARTALVRYRGRADRVLDLLGRFWGASVAGTRAARWSTLIGVAHLLRGESVPRDPGVELPRQAW